jgi:hypothetical protein
MIYYIIIISKNLLPTYGTASKYGTALIASPDDARELLVSLFHSHTVFASGYDFHVDESQSNHPAEMLE